jgi:rod shape determining protein RodA
MNSESITKLFKHFDAFLMATLMFALLIGLFVLYSASGESMGPVYKQLINIGVAFFLMWIVTNISPSDLQRLALPLYLVGVLLLVLVEFFGTTSHGAQRWLNLGIMKIQPSEIMRIAMPMMVAWYLSKQDGKLTAKHYFFGGLLLILPVGLIMMQPDLGTSLLITASGFYVLFLAGLSLRFLLGSSIFLLAMSPVFWSMLHDYQRTRIEILLDPTTDPLGAGYHTIQSMIAIGSGGAAGKGWMNGTQTQLEFLPERTTDFIFAVFGEEFGLLGNLMLLVMFLLIIFRGLMIASEADSGFSRLLAGSITLTFFTYAFVNMGMVSGILPIVGVPLPLISYGGTSMVTLCISFGILMSIQSDKKLVAR